MAVAASTGLNTSTAVHPALYGVADMSYDDDDGIASLKLPWDVDRGTVPQAKAWLRPPPVPGAGAAVTAARWAMMLGTSGASMSQDGK